MMENKYHERNQIAQRWGKSTKKDIVTEARALGVRSYSGRYYRQFRDRYYRNGGRVTTIAFRMVRHMVFVEKGVGRGYPIEAAGRDLFGKPGARQTKAAMLAKGYNKSAIMMALRKTGHGNALKGKPRKPKPAFNPVIESQLPKLADGIARTDADIYAKNLFIN